MDDVIFTNIGLKKISYDKHIKNGFDYEFLERRNDKQWTSMDGNRRLIKDLSNDHLINIIDYINKHSNGFSNRTKDFCLTEKRFREVNNIIVPEYEK